MSILYLSVLTNPQLRSWSDHSWLKQGKSVGVLDKLYPVAIGFENDWKNLFQLNPLFGLIFHSDTILKIYLCKLAKFLFWFVFERADKRQNIDLRHKDCS